MYGGFAVIASLIFAMTLVFAVASHPQNVKAPYPSMAPIEQYLMDRDGEIDLARSAAPDAISGDARILVLGRHGYETAVEGNNGFVCVVERGWMSPSEAPEFWNPKNSGSNLLQSAGRAIRFADYLQENRDGISRAN